MWIPLPPPMAGPEMASALLADACKRHLPDLAIESASLRTSNMAKGRLDWSGVRSFSRAYRRFVRRTIECDTVYLVAAANVVGSVRDAILIATARTLRRDVVIHLRGGRYGEFYREAPWLLRWLLRRSWGSAKTAIVQTPSLQDALVEAAPHVPTVVVPNALPSTMPPTKRAHATAAPRILFVGHLTYAKGFYDLVYAFRELRKAHPRATLVCAGERPTADRGPAEFLPRHRRNEYLSRAQLIRDEILEFITSDPGVDYRGVVSGDEKWALFESADLFVLPSYTEGFSMAVLEAMFYALPVIVGNAGGSPDVIRDGDNGFVVTPGDRVQLLGALKTLIDQRELREAIGNRNAAEARERYDLDVVSRRLVAVLTGDAPLG